MRVVVTGGRDYADRAKVFAFLEAIRMEQGALWLAHGACPTGADRWAAEFADECPDVDVTPYPAAWDVWGRKAGPIRNGLMLDHFKPDLVLAFPGGNGTADCVKAARERGIKVVEVSP